MPAAYYSADTTSMYRHGHERQLQFDKEDKKGNVQQGGWKDVAYLIEVEQQRGAKQLFLQLFQYFNSPAGAVPFQE